MANFKVSVDIVFQGVIDIENVKSKEEATEHVMKHFGAIIGPIQTTSPNIKDWSFNVHPVKNIELCVKT